MKERPILFSPEMVRAILAGRKTQTRRVVKTQPDCLGKLSNPFSPQEAYQNGFLLERWPKCERMMDNFGRCERIHCPKGVPGDRLWVKEGWRPYISHSCALNTCDCADVVVRYMADKEERFFYDGDIPAEWTMPKAADKHTVTSLFMPKWASRIKLEITEVRVQRVQEISCNDAFAEGIRVPCYDEDISSETLKGLAVGGFSRLWDSINGKKHTWASNPWVWAISFRKLEGQNAGDETAERNLAVH